MLAKSESERQDLIPPLPTNTGLEKIGFAFPEFILRKRNTSHQPDHHHAHAPKGGGRTVNRLVFYIGWFLGHIKMRRLSLCEAPSRGCILTTRIFVVDLSVSEEEISHRRDCGWVVLPYHDDYVRHVLFPPLLEFGMRWPSGLRADTDWTNTHTPPAGDI